MHHIFQRYFLNNESGISIIENLRMFYCEQTRAKLPRLQIFKSGRSMVFPLKKRFFPFFFDLCFLAFANEADCASME